MMAAIFLRTADLWWESADWLRATMHQLRIHLSSSEKYPRYLMKRERERERENEGERERERM